MKKIFLIIFLGVLFFPSISLAGTYMACDGTINPIGQCVGSYVNLYYEGLVPCGKRVCKFNPTTAGTADPCVGKVGVKYLECQLRAGQNLEQACISPVGIPPLIGKVITGTQGQPIEIGFPCTFCHLFVMIDGIIDFVLFQLVPPLAILMLAIAGIMYIIAQFAGAEILPEGGKGGPAMFGQAKKTINSVIIGLIIIYAGWLVINLFFQVIGVAPWTGLQNGWFSIQCPMTLP